MLQDDRNLSAHDIQALEGRDALGRFFATLGYNTDKRQVQTADALGIGQGALRSALKHVERISANDSLQVFVFEVASVTLAHRRAITALLNNRDGDFLFVLTSPEYERLDFVLVERFRSEAAEDAPGASTVRARPLAISVERRKPTPEALRTLRRMTFTCSDDLGQLEKLLSAFRIAQWSEARFNNVALFSDHYLKHRLTEEPEWKDADGAKAAFKAIRAIGDRNKDAQAKTIDEVVLPVLKQFGHDPKPAKAADGGLMFRLSENVVCFGYHWLRALDTKDDNSDHPDDIPAVRVVSEFEQTKAQWAILTNGKQWRLYCARAHSRHASFYEVDFRETLATQEADGETFRYFWLMFRAEAFKRGPEAEDKPGLSFLDHIFDGSRTYAKELGERLKSRVFEEIFPHFAEGFIAHIRATENNPDLSEERLHEVFRATLTLLYRLIFLLYAESLDLLPVTETNYRDVSLRKLTQELAERAGRNEAQAVEKIQQAFTPSATVLYDRLAELFRVIDEGDNKVNVPKYNGGLFITKPSLDDHSDEANAARFLSKFKVPDRFLALGLDRLARDEDPKSHSLAAVDYKSLGVRQLGSIYEGLLEFKVQVAAERMALVKGKKGEAIVPATQAEKEELTIATRVKMHGAEGGFLRKGTVYLANDKHERKASGSYYTPDYIVKYIVENTVGPVLEEKLNALRPEFRKAEVEYHAARKKDAALKKQGLSDDPEKVANSYRDLVDALFTLRVLDPAMGSGHFLVEAVDFITDRMLAFLSGFAWNPVQHFIQRTRRDIQAALNKAEITVDPAKLTDINLLKRHVLKRCIFGVDLNPMAVELAKVSLWLDCFTLGAPLSFLDHHLKCGNSLIGVTVEEVEKTLKKSAGMFSSRFAGLMLATDIARQIAALPDSTAEQAAKSRSEHNRAQDALAPFKRLLDIYTSQWFGNGEVTSPANSTARKGGGRKQPGQIAAIEWLNSDAVKELLSANAEGFVEETGRPFTAKPQMTVFEKTDTSLLKDKKKRKPSITDKVNNQADAWFNNVPKLASKAQAEHRFLHWELEFPEVYFAPTTPGGQNIKRIAGAGFDAIVGNPPYDELSEHESGCELPEKGFLRSAKQFHDALGGRLNVFRFFVLNSLLLLRPRGWHSFIVPMSILADSFTAPLRKRLINEGVLRSIIAFPQKGDPHRRVFLEAKLSTCIYVLQRTAEPAHSIQVRTYPGNSMLDKPRSCELTGMDIRSLEPNGLSIPAIDSQDLNLWRRMASQPTTTTLAQVAPCYLGEIMFNASSSDLISRDPIGPRIYRGANVNRYQMLEDAKQGEIVYLDYKLYLDRYANDARIDHHKKPRIAFQEAAPIDNWRRLIPAYMPADLICGHTLRYFTLDSRYDLYALLACFASSACEWRFGLTSTNNHVNAYEVDALLIPRFMRPDRAEGVAWQKWDRLLGGSANAWEDEIRKIIVTAGSTVVDWPNEIHDGLAAAGRRLSGLGDTLRATADLFCEWLISHCQIDEERFVGIGYLRGGQARAEELGTGGFWELLVRNRGACKADPVLQQVMLMRKYEEAASKLLRARSEFAALDEAVDLIVWRLLGIDKSGPT